MINSLIELLKSGGKQSGHVYDGFYEADVYDSEQSYTLKLNFGTEYQPSEVEFSDELGRDKAVEATQTIVLTDIEECWVNDEDGTQLMPNAEQGKLIIELIEITV